MIAATFREMDSTVDKVSANAASVLFQVDKLKGLPTTEELKKLARDLNVSHFYITDETGRFIRHTDLRVEDVKYKLFDFCEDYRQLITGNTLIQQTPIIPSELGSYTGPYKFTMIPNHNRTRVLEVGYHMRFIADTLFEVVKSDKNIRSIGFFSPSGFELGSISADGKLTHGRVMDSAEISQESVKVSGTGVTVNTLIPAGTKNCCECRFKKVSSVSGDYFYALRTEVSLQPFLDDLAGMRKGLILLVLILFFVSGGAAALLSRLLVRELNVINLGVGKVMESNDLSARILVKGSHEFTRLAENFNKMIGRLAESQKNELDRERHRAMGQISSQVAHDIRSPLAALDNVIGHTTVLPEDDRILVRAAINRIKDIANNLIEKNRELKFGPRGAGEEVSTSAEVPMVQLLSSLVEPLITEKRMQFRSKIGIEIDGRVNTSSYGLFAKIQPTEFKRVLSNLVNNAVEVLGDKGTVTITLATKSDQIEIRITDNGKGIPAEILAKLGQRGETHGKQGGSGLGLYHARTSVESWGGKLQLASEVGKGTTVIITLPQAKAPEWFVSELILTPQIPVVVLDDDSSIHGIWQGRFDSLGVAEKGIDVMHFSTPDELTKWVTESPAAKTALYLADFELLGHKQTGLDLIEALKLGPQSILVTSRFEEKHIMEGCRRLGVRLIPTSFEIFE
ncbi:HAMP domain-containing sensor histidine kinase [Bdellovibrionota bacterium FG-1]